MDFWEILSRLEGFSPALSLLMLFAFLLLSNDFKRLKKDQEDQASNTNREMASIKKSQKSLNERLDRLYSTDTPPAQKEGDHPLVID